MISDGGPPWGERYHGGFAFQVAPPAGGEQMIIFNCPKCGKEFRAKDNYEGCKFTCTECGEKGRVPTLQDAQNPLVIAVADSVPTKVRSVPPPLKNHVKAPPKPPKEPAEESSAPKDEQSLTTPISKQNFMNDPLSVSSIPTIKPTIPATPGQTAMGCLILIAVPVGLWMVGSMLVSALSDYMGPDIHRGSSSSSQKAPECWQCGAKLSVFDRDVSYCDKCLKESKAKSDAKVLEWQIRNR